MPTIVDELVTTLKLDSSDFAQKKRQIESDLDSLKKASVSAGKQIKDGSKEATDVFASLWNDRIERIEGNLKNLTTESRRTAINMKSSGKEAAEFFTNLKSEALGLIGVLVGATGLTSMLRSSAEAARSLKQEAAAINVDPQRLSAMSLALERRGGSAEATRGSLMGISQALERRRLQGDPSIMPWLGLIGANPNQSPDQILEEFIAYAQKNKTNGPQVNLVGHGLGIDMGTISAAMSFKSMDDYRQTYSDALRDSPTHKEIDDLDALKTKFTELEQAVQKFGTDYAADNSDLLGHILDETKDFLRDHPKLLEGITDIAAAMGTLKAARISASLLGFDGFAAALKTIDGLLTSIVLRLSTLAIPLALSGDTPKGPEYQEQPGSEWFGNNGAVAHWWQRTMPSWMGGSASQSNINVPEAPSKAAAVMQRSHDFFRSKGLTEEQTAGILANIAAESGFDPTKSGDNGTSYGLFQHHADRLSAMQAQYGTNPSVDQQLAFAWQEMQSQGIAQQIRGTSTASQSAAIFSNGFERPANGATEASRRAQAAGKFVSHPAAVAPPALPRAPRDLTPMIFPGAYQQPEGTTDNSRTVTVHNVNINTKATDAGGIARDFAQALVVQANRGLV